MSDANPTRESHDDANISTAKRDREYEDYNLDSALRYYESALHSFHILRDKEGEAVVLLRLSRVYEARLDPSKALWAAKTATELLSHSEDRALSNDARQRFEELSKNV